MTILGIPSSLQRNLSSNWTEQHSALPCTLTVVATTQISFFVLWAVRIEAVGDHEHRHGADDQRDQDAGQDQPLVIPATILGIHVPLTMMAATQTSMASIVQPKAGQDQVPVATACRYAFNPTMTTHSSVPNSAMTRFSPDRWLGPDGRFGPSPEGKPPARMAPAMM